MLSSQNLLGASVTVEPPKDAEWHAFDGVVRSTYVGNDRMRFVVKPNDQDRLYDVPAHACEVHDPEPSDAKDDPSGNMTEIAAVAIDYVMQNPEREEGNEFQASLLAAVAGWMQKDPQEKERSYWLTDMCAAGHCDQCHHDSCECPHHTGVEMS